MLFYMALLAECSLESLSPISFSRPYEMEKLAKESAAAYEERTWRERLHYDERGIVFIPPMAFKLALSQTAKYLGMQIKGKGKSTYTKHFQSGVLVLEGLSLGIHKDQVLSERLFVPSDGIAGSAKRVYKTFGIIHEWKGKVVFTILDRTITEDVFEEHLREMGRFIGLGRWRPANGGLKGRFKVVGIKWSED